MQKWRIAEQQSQEVIHIMNENKDKGKSMEKKFSEKKTSKLDSQVLEGVV